MKFKEGEVVVILTETTREMPFYWADKFVILRIHNMNDLELVVKKLISSKKPKVVVFDSFTQFHIMAIEEAKKKTDNGFKVQAEVNTTTAKLMKEYISDIKKSGKAVIVTAIEETINESGNIYRRASITGKAYGNIEAFFDIVLFTQTNESGEKYLLQTQKQGITPAKTPPNMFTKDEFFIPNDMSKIYDRMIWYLGLDKNNPDVGKFYSILIIGHTGTGKTSSIGNLVEHDDVKTDESTRPSVL